MLISIRKVATTISLSRFPPHLTQSRRVLPILPHSPISTGRNPKPLLETLKEHGFTDAQIDIIARKAPRIISSRSGDLVRTKMSYLCQELGLDRSDLVKIVTSDPTVLHSSLKHTIIPSINYLESVLGSRCRVIRVILRAPWLLRHTHIRVVANVAMLKDSGVPDSSITKLLLAQQCNLRYHNLEQFRLLLDSVLSAGFAPSTPMFMHAIHVKSSMSSSTWLKKIRVYLSFGWSAEEAELAFRKWPAFYGYSEERLIKQLDFVMNVLRMRPMEVLAYKKVMTCSLEGTLIPRCCVLNLLMRRGLVKMDMNVPSILNLSKNRFVKRIVEKYQDRAPEVLEAYQGNMQFRGFDPK